MFSRCQLFAAIALTISAAQPWSAPSFAEDAVAVEIVLKDSGFEPKEVKVPAGKPLAITVRNETKAAAEFESKGLKIEKVVAANSQGVFRVKPLTKGTYLFVNEYKEDTIQGNFIVE